MPPSAQRLTLRQAEPPHGVRDTTLFGSLVDAYRADRTVPPVVFLTFGEEGIAYGLSGSHRLAAAKEVFEEDTELETLDWIVLDAEPLYEAAGPQLQATLDRFRERRAGDFGVLLQTLWPYLPAKAQAALENQR